MVLRSTDNCIELYDSVVMYTKHEHKYATRSRSNEFKSCVSKVNEMSNLNLISYRILLLTC